MLTHFLYHNIGGILENHTFVHFIGDIMLVRSDNQEVASILKALIRHMNSRR